MKALLSIIGILLLTQLTYSDTWTALSDSGSLVGTGEEANISLADISLSQSWEIYKVWDKFNVDVLIDTHGWKIVWFKTSIKFDQKFVRAASFTNDNTVTLWPVKQINSSEWIIDLIWWFDEWFVSDSPKAVISITFEWKHENISSWINIEKEKTSINSYQEPEKNIIWTNSWLIARIVNKNTNIIEYEAKIKERREIESLREKYKAIILANESKANSKSWIKQVVNKEDYLTNDKEKKPEEVFKQASTAKYSIKWYKEIEKVQLKTFIGMEILLAWIVAVILYLYSKKKFKDFLRNPFRI